MRELANAATTRLSLAFVAVLMVPAAVLAQPAPEQATPALKPNRQAVFGEPVQKCRFEVPHVSTRMAPTIVGNELVILDPAAHPEGLPAVQLLRTANPQRLQVDIPPTLHVHRYYYTGPKEFPAPYVAGGPCVLVANNPWNGQRMYVDVLLPPGFPIVAYTKCSIAYIYPDRRRVTITFPVLFHDTAKVSYCGLCNFHFQKACNQHGVPNHPYGYDEERRGLTVRSQVGIEDQVSMLVGAGSPCCQNAWDPAPPMRPALVRRRQFSIGAPVLVVESIQLDQIALAVYATGQVFCSGRIVHADGGYQGHQVIIRVRARGTFSGPELPGSPTEGPLLWEGTQTLWVAPGLPRVISLAPCFSQEVRSHFGEITHLELSLEYGMNR